MPASGNAGCGRWRSRRRRGEDGLLAGHAGHVGTRVQKNRKQQVCDRSGRDDCDAPPYACTVERARKILRHDVALALVGHLHVTAQRNRGDRELGAIATVAARPQHAAEADREPQDLHAAQARDDVMAGLVEHDEDAEHDQKRDDLERDVHDSDC
jgi:hypothetical protein